eukprot:c195_g1_i1.p1 GENE.c195_g1_i1~~c195_g1_i1.p1  ORF type:complete len:508 (+),score=136.16 c195_g1_i1:1-1524(+)
MGVTESSTMPTHDQNDLIALLLKAVNSADKIADSLEFAKQHSIPHVDVVEALKTLVANEYVLLEVIEHASWKLTPEAHAFRTDGTPEARVFANVPKSGILVDDLNAKLGAEIAKIGMGQGLKAKWLRLDKADGKPILFREAEQIQDELPALFDQLEKGAELDKATIDKLKTRKCIAKEVIKSFAVTKGPKFQPVFAKLHADFNMEMIASGEWETLSFKPLRFDVDGRPPEWGCLHPLLKVREEFRQIFLEFGFQEMPTNRFVESSFWNFDALFQPQAHPARDAHDTFFISEPAQALSIPEDYMKRVKQMHQSGDDQSRGWRYVWQESEARKNILRTHTTAISSQMLYKLAQDGFKPAKYFSIDRVFRNEKLDAKHLAEFHQIEGVVCDRGLGLADLMGIVKHFFERMGLHDMVFKPAYNPYTEPSMEIFYRHPDPAVGLMEVGNSGVFRPEMLRPMGLPDDCTVIAWGFGLERPTMIKYGIRNIRELFGHQVKFDNIRNNPICRLDK